MCVGRGIAQGKRHAGCKITSHTGDCAWTGTYLGDGHMNSYRNGLLRQLSLESLENRALLAGNVLASVTDGNLLISGDASANNIRIVQTAEGTFEITGVRTKINGTNSATLTGVTGDVTVQLGNGNDAVSIGADTDADVSLAGNLTVDGGAGNDSIKIKGLNVDGDVAVSGGAGNDSIAAAGLDVTGALDIDAGTGNDTAKLSDAIAASAAIALGEGNDSIVLADVDADIDLDAGAGNDKVSIRINASEDEALSSQLNISLGSGNDSLVGNVDVVGDVNVDAEAGNDKVSLSGSVDGDVDVDLGDGNDSLALNDLEVTGAVSLLASAGNDQLKIRALAADELFADLGQGNDSLAVRGGLSFTNSVEIRGGDGRDSLRGTSLIDIEDLFEFETLRL
jgi:Ca2+-binding RTX toxin-like protein